MSFYPDARSTYSRSFPDLFLAIQPGKNWTGTEPLPGPIADYYSSVGPVDLKLPWLGKSLELPSLRNLWPLQAGFRFDPKTRARYKDWPSNWWVIALAKPTVYVYDDTTHAVGRVWREKLRWISEDIFNGMDEFAAVTVKLSALFRDKGDILLGEDGSLSAEGGDELLLALFDLCNRDVDKAEALIIKMGWAKA